MKIVILGGGTAGYISAIFIKSYFPDSDVTVVASKVLGTVGPGEGLTPLFNLFMKDAQIDRQRFMDESYATIKEGINFINWTKDPGEYLITLANPINILGDITGDKDSFFKHFKTALASSDGLEALNIHAKYSRLNRVAISDEDTYAYHVDAQKMIKFFETISEEKGISIIDDIVTNINSDHNGNITSLDTESRNKIDLDFIVDSSGFRRLIVGDHYKEDWISVNDNLIVNSAIACFMPADEEIKPYTQAIAMKYGWAWKIPLQHRSGCGYAYSDKYITAEQAEEELKEVLGQDIQVMHRLKFNAGFYNNVMVKNCLAIGLASSFFEPLEASSIDRALGILYYSIDVIKSIKDNDPEITLKVKKFNDKVRAGHHELLDYIYLHYMTNRDDTEFWKDVKLSPRPSHEDSKIPFFLNFNDFVNNMNSDLAQKLNFENNTWIFQSWSTIFAENNVDRNNFVVDNVGTNGYNDIVNRIEGMAELFEPHSKYLTHKK